MNEHGQIKVEDFCHTYGASGVVHSIQVQAKDLQGLVVDIGEFIVKAWGHDLVDGVVEWIRHIPPTRQAVSYELSSLRLSGDRYGGDECYETMSTVTVEGGS